VRVQRRGRENITVVTRPGGVQIVTVVDQDGRLIRRARRGRDGREVVIIDNRARGRGAVPGRYYVELPPPVLRIPRERYIVEAEGASGDAIYETFMEPPVERLQRAYSLDEVRYSPEVRARMPRVDIDTINFETGSWEITPDQAERLSVIAAAINRAIERNANEVFLIEGHTDAVGNDVDNLSLSDRRAESVAYVLTEQFQVPAENLTTQGYGAQYPKVQTDGAERRNRRVSILRITPLLAGRADDSPARVPVQDDRRLPPRR
jgi:outer membrane protein OmpA-like peptidoglycan-associated protein